MSGWGAAVWAAPRRVHTPTHCEPHSRPAPAAAGACACDSPASDKSHRIRLDEATVLSEAMAWEVETMPGGRGGRRCGGGKGAQSHRIRLDEGTVLSEAMAWEVETVPGGWGWKGHSTALVCALVAARTGLPSAAPSPPLKPPGPRVMVDATLLPNGRVLLVNGARVSPS